MGPYYGAIAAALLLVLVGGWLLLAPWALGYQPVGGGATATGNDVLCGVVLVLVAVVRLLLVGRALHGALRALGIVPGRSRPGADAGTARRADLHLLAATLSVQVPLVVAVWLIVSPWVLQTQRVGAAWTPGTVNNLALGTVVLAVAVLGLGAALLQALQQAHRRGA